MTRKYTFKKERTFKNSAEVREYQRTMQRALREKKRKARLSDMKGDPERRAPTTRESEMSTNE
jgi:hypothetical protein